MTRAQRIGSVLALLLLAAGAVRFVQAGLLPATHRLTGDFGANFPNVYFAWLRPDFSTDQTRGWPGWSYGPMLHFLTLPLFLAPRWWMVPPLWALTNLIAITTSFVCACRLSGAASLPTLALAIQMPRHRWRLGRAARE